MQRRMPMHGNGSMIWRIAPPPNRVLLPSSSPPPAIYVHVDLNIFARGAILDPCKFLRRKRSLSSSSHHVFFHSRNLCLYFTNIQYFPASRIVSSISPLFFSRFMTKFVEFVPALSPLTFFFFFVFLKSLYFRKHLLVVGKFSFADEPSGDSDALILGRAYPLSISRDLSPSHRRRSYIGSRTIDK